MIVRARKEETVDQEPVQVWKKVASEGCGDGLKGILMETGVNDVSTR